MKLQVTDKFLWSVYQFFEDTQDVLEMPEIFKLKSFSRIGPCLGKEYWRALEKKRQKRQFSQFINYLKRKKYIKIENLKGKSGILLTSQGREKALIAKRELLQKRKRKDGKWVMIMYDVPESKKKARHFLRQTLLSLGYQCLQKSIWVSPYDVFKETEEAIRVSLLDEFVRIFLIEEITW